MEVNVVDPFLRKGYRFRGRAEVHTEGAFFHEAVGFFGRGADAVEHPQERIRSIVLIEVDRALPLVSPAYELGTSEEEIVAFWERYYSSLDRPGSPKPGTGPKPRASY
jgi:hypothetical protein